MGFMYRNCNTSEIKIKVYEIEVFVIELKKRTVVTAF